MDPFGNFSLLSFAGFSWEWVCTHVEWEQCPLAIDDNTTFNTNLTVILVLNVIFKYFNTENRNYLHECKIIPVSQRVMCV